MKSKILVFALVLTSCSAHSGNKPADEGANQNAAPPLTQEQIQKNMVEASTPTANHAVLKKFAGTWKVESKFWMSPEGKPEVSKGVSVNKLLFGGRFLSSAYKGKAMGQPFEGESLIGYDNVGKKYFSTWIDSMSTALYKTDGSANADSSQITFNASFVCPMTRTEMSSEDQLTLIDKNHYKFESYKVDGGKKEKVMELNYTRAK